MLKFKLNQRGFTLAEGMVTAGLLGVVSLGLLQGLKEDSKSKIRMRQEDEVQAIMATVEYYFRDSTSCKLTLDNAGINVNIGGVINQIRDSGGVANYQPADGGAAIPLSTPVFLQGGNTITTDTLRVQEMSVVAYKQYFSVDSKANGGATGVSTNYGSMEVRVKFRTSERGRDVDDNPTLVTRDTTRAINILVASNAAGQIQDCVNQADLMTLQLKDKMCAQEYSYINPSTGLPETMMIGSYNSNTGACGGIQESIRYLGSQQMCAELGGHLETNPLGDTVCSFRPSFECPNGISSFDANGVPQCNP